jgi:leader peptidase (prepilin peptidase)/N-methyltransferase
MSSPWFWCLWIIAGGWCVSRLIVWYPEWLRFEEAHWRKAVLLEQAVDPSLTMPTALAPEPFVRIPSLSKKSLVAVTLVTTIALWVLWQYPETVVAMLWMINGWTLIALALIDYQTRLLPDMMTLPLLWLGLLIQLWPETSTVGLEMAVIGAVAGYLPLWLLAHVYRLIRQREGLGMGDLKLLAAMGAWSGPWLLPYVMLVAAILAITGVLVCRFLARRKIGIQEEFPFGPAMILAYGIMLFATTR